MPTSPHDSGTGEPGFAVYVHWPFCQSKCPYCDFNSHVRANGIDERGFLKAYLHELQSTADLVPGREVSSIFFGGGTPSLMRPESVATIIDEIARLWSLDADAEITLEANPSSVEAGRFRGYLGAGVNRLSLGVQALRDRDLRALGRLHDVADARRAIALARETFPRMSFDLIYARSGQTAEDWRAELGEALSLGPDHLSLYQLTIEPGTAFAGLHAAGKLTVPDAKSAAELFECTQETCNGAGLPAYEISNHARAGRECRHNLTYWRYGEYAGIGPGAHGRLVMDGKRYATQTERHPESWAVRVGETGHGQTERAALSLDEQADEMVLMGLRLNEGLSVARLEATTGYAIEECEIDATVCAGLIERIGSGNIRPTAEGMLVLNTVVLQLASHLRPAKRTAANAVTQDAASQ